MDTKHHNILPGFGVSLGFALSYLSLIVLIPLSAVFLKTATAGWTHIWETVTDPRVVATYKLTFGVAFLSALLNAFFGLLVAWVLARYSFPGRSIVDALVDLPFALPTAVAGIALTQIYSGNGWIGSHLESIGIRVAFTPLGVLVAMMFVGLPFVVRNVQPVIADIDLETEEAALSLGATRWQTFSRVIVPAILPALITGFSLAFARALGEYGSIVFISANIPFQTEITAFEIVTKLEQFDYTGATAIAIVMLFVSFLLLLGINLLQARTRRFERTA